MPGLEAALPSFREIESSIRDIHMGERLVVGIDAGGSKTAVVAEYEGARDQFQRTGAGANLQRIGLEAAAQILVDHVAAALSHFPGTRRLAACAGMAGAGSSEDSQRLAHKWRSLLPSDLDAQVEVVHDGEVALEGAFEGQSGAILIAGTGSVILVRFVDGTFRRAGGWGYLIGDEGGGNALGFAGLRAVAAAIDGGPETSLRHLFSERHGLSTRDEIIARVYGESFPVQRLAPTIVGAAEHGDRVAREIVHREARALVRQLVWACAAGPAVEQRVAPLGGLTNESYYRVVLQDKIGAALPAWEMTDPLGPPVLGALRLAQKLGG